MRLNRLFAVVAPIVLLLPLAAHADWPKGEREKYMAQCTQAATPQIGAAAAKVSLRLRCRRDQIVPGQRHSGPDGQQGQSDALKQKALGKIAKCKANNTGEKISPTQRF